jgi:hypothetical protein
MGWDEESCPCIGKEDCVLLVKPMGERKIGEEDLETRFVWAKLEL